MKVNQGETWLSDRQDQVRCNRGERCGRAEMLSHCLELEFSLWRLCSHRMASRSVMDRSLAGVRLRDSSVTQERNQLYPCNPITGKCTAFMIKEIRSNFNVQSRGIKYPTGALCENDIDVY